MASLEETHDPKRVEEDRSIAIEAAIVCWCWCGAALCGIDLAPSIAMVCQPLGLIEAYGGSFVSGTHDEDPEDTLTPAAHHRCDDAAALFQAQSQGLLCSSRPASRTLIGISELVRGE